MLILRLCSPSRQFAERGRKAELDFEHFLSLNKEKKKTLTESHGSHLSLSGINERALLFKEQSQPFFDELGFSIEMDSKLAEKKNWKNG